jgi:hypothetical protein
LEPATCGVTTWVQRRSILPTINEVEARAIAAAGIKITIGAEFRCANRVAGILLAPVLDQDLLGTSHGVAACPVAATAGCLQHRQNRVIVRGDRRVADIYFTEFNRLFNHYYFRSIAERSNPTETLHGLYLVEDDSWLEKYRPGELIEAGRKLRSDGALTPFIGDMTCNTRQQS